MTADEARKLTLQALLLDRELAGRVFPQLVADEVSAILIAVRTTAGRGQRVLTRLITKPDDRGILTYLETLDQAIKDELTRLGYAISSSIAPYRDHYELRIEVRW